MKDNRVWVDMTKAPRETVEQCFIAQRDEIMARIIRFQGEMDSYNRNRFAEDPIIVGMDFTAQLDKYLGTSEEEKIRLYSRAFDMLEIVEGE
jgi:hypothetical protein